MAAVLEFFQDMNIDKLTMFHFHACFSVALASAHKCLQNHKNIGNPKHLGRCSVLGDQPNPAFLACSLCLLRKQCFGLSMLPRKVVVTCSSDHKQSRTQTKQAQELRGQICIQYKSLSISLIKI